jgi:cell division protein FtsN
MVRCVTSPTLFLDEYFEGAQRKVPGGATHVTGAARGGRVVQVGSFGVPSNATRLRARLQNEGMPARIYQSRGLNVVTVGPFSSADSAHRALASVRQMGFGDAFLR